MKKVFRQKRLRLQVVLEELMASRNVYFQPPSSFKMNYPCIVYELSRIQNQHADNLPYLKGVGFSITYITKNPDDDLVMKLNELPYTYFDTHFVSDNLHHYQYTTYI